MKQNVSIVIINYKTFDHLQKCLSRLPSQEAVFDITVVDNNSQSQSKLETLKKKFPKVKWIENDTNKGFSFAANQGVIEAKGRWILFLNPDVSLDKTEVEDLFHYAEREHLDAISPTFNDERYSKPIPSLFSLLSEFTPLHLVKHSSTSQKTLVGGCLLIKKKVLEQLGGWDERFFLWFEDSDLTKRLLDNGYKIGFAPFSVHHSGGASVNALKEYISKQIFFHSMDIYVRKHFSIGEQQIVRKSIIDRFSAVKGYPVSNIGSTWVVPNMRLDLLEDFLSVNKTFFSRSELVIVSSRLIGKKVWEFRKKYPGVRFIPIAQNKGFAHTVNIGLRVATTKSAGTVNDDVIMNEHTIPKLLNAFNSEIGSMNPVIYSLNEHIESAGIAVLKKGKAHPITEMPKESLTIVPATNGACVLYNTEALERVGLFDEKFGSYLEDIDLSLRLRKAGYLNAVVKASRVIHAKHSTSKSFGKYKNYLDLKNWLLVIGKNWSASDTVVHFPHIIVERLRNISGLIK